MGVINDELQRRSSESSPGDTVSGSETDPSADEACRKLDVLNRGLSAGTITPQQFDAQFQGLMKACDGAL
jgi:hypothetical protein